MAEDLNQLYAFDVIPLMPRLQPRYWPYAPVSDGRFEVYRCTTNMHLPMTTLDVYEAPTPPGWKQDLGQTKLVPLQSGYSTYGNAPTSGVYTGVQQE